MRILEDLEDVLQIHLSMLSYLADQRLVSPKHLRNYSEKHT